MKKRKGNLMNDWIVLSDVSGDSDDENISEEPLHSIINPATVPEQTKAHSPQRVKNSNGDCKIEESDSGDIEIKFKNFDISSKYRSDIKKWLCEKLKSEGTVFECIESEFELQLWFTDSSADKSLVKPQSQLSESISDSFIILDKLSSNSPASPSSEDAADNSSVACDTTITVTDTGNTNIEPDCSDLFFVDTKPKTKETVAVPSTVKQAKFLVLSDRVEKDGGNKETNASPARSSFCFNCGGSHSVRDCPEPPDPMRINKNRRDFIQKNWKNNRYHEDDEQKFGSLRPGKISSKLRHALGLSKRHIPLHVYQMRKYGYPPGWLNDARIPHSGIQMFQHGGIEVTDPNMETSDDSSRDKYDTKKFIAYPGFNVIPDPDIEDRFYEFNCPPMDERQSLENMIKHFDSKSYKSYKSSKRKFNISLNPFHDDLTITDMDMGVVSEDDTIEVNPPLPSENLPNAPPLPVKPPPPGVDDAMEGQTEAWLKSEDDTIEVNPPLPPENPPSAPPLPVSPPPPGVDDAMEGQTEAWLSEESNSLERCMSPTLVELEEKKKLLLGELNSTPVHAVNPESTDLGTPIIVSASPFSNLPTPDKFSADISDVMTFENLPEYTGTYVRLSRVISKVRDELKEIEQDE